MPVADVQKARTTRIADRRIDAADAKAILDAAGKSVSKDELEELKKTLKPQNGEYVVAPEASRYLGKEIRTLESMGRQAKAINEEVKARAPKLAAEESAMLKEGVTTKSYGGTVIPEQVKKLVNEMKKNGAVAYDVLESDPKPERDEHDPTQWTLTGVWSPYGVQDAVPATGPMAFKYTELTPKAIEDDMNTERMQWVMTGVKTHEEVDRRSGEKMTWNEPQYEQRKMKGTGNIVEHYDEDSHSNVFALMPDGEGNCKWDANFAVLADGTFHALPAMRRSDDPNFAGLILTDPSLARDKRMLFNGHIGMDNGVVTSIGISGRLQKLAASGDAKFANPVKLLEAWGFKMSPNLQVSFEGSGAVKIDASTNLITKA